MNEKIINEAGQTAIELLETVRNVSDPKIAVLSLNNALLRFYAKGQKESAFIPPIDGKKVSNMLSGVLSDILKPKSNSNRGPK
jgi:hypothetical protein